LLDLFSSSVPSRTTVASSVSSSSTLVSFSTLLWLSRRRGRRGIVLKLLFKGGVASLSLDRADFLCLGLSERSPPFVAWALFPGESHHVADLIHSEFGEIVLLGDQLGEGVHIRGEFGEEYEATKMFGEGTFSLFHSGEVPDELVDGERGVGVLGDSKVDGHFEFLVGGGDAWLSKFCFEGIPENTGVVDAFVFVNNGGVEPEVDVSSSSAVCVLPLLDGFLVYWVGGGIWFGDSDVLPLIVLFDDGVHGELRLGSGTEQDPPLPLAGEIRLHDGGPDRVVWSGEMGDGGEDGVGRGAGHCW